MREFTLEDKELQTPNLVTHYSFHGLNLHTEPTVISVPSFEKNRYLTDQ